MSDRQAFHSLGDKVMIPEEVIFPLESFISSLWYHLGRPHSEFNGDDFWEVVIRDSSKARPTLMTWNRLQLQQYIIDNKFHITRNFSARAKHNLNLRLEELNWRSCARES